MIRFSEFRDNYCKHQGAWLEFDKDEGTVKACCFKDGKPAEGWRIGRNAARKTVLH